MNAKLEGQWGHKNQENKRPVKKKKRGSLFRGYQKKTRWQPCALLQGLPRMRASMETCDGDKEKWGPGGRGQVGSVKSLDGGDGGGRGNKRGGMSRVKATRLRSVLLMGTCCPREI